MIISPNRFKTSLCWRKIFNRYHRKLGVTRNLTLSEGGAFHTGVAKGLASKDWQAGRQAAREEFDKLAAELPLLPEQEYQLKDFKDLIDVMIDEFEKAYKEDTYEVVQPECQFDVALPDSGHNCIWQHWRDIETGENVFVENTSPPIPFSGPPAEKILRGVIKSPHIDPDPTCDCWQPHRLVGFTDALITKNHAFWLQDHKTTAMVNDQFWSQFNMDWAMTAYIYGIWKSTGIKPHGFWINALFRPTEKQVAAWNAKRKSGALQVKDYVKFNREAFLRDDKDLARFEHQAINFGNEWEWRITQGNFDEKPSSFTCTAYNRRCDYYQMCLTHDEDQEGLATIEPGRPKDELVQEVTV